MIDTKTKQVLQDYSDDKIGWREACSLVYADNLDELESLIKTHNITPSFQAKLKRGTHE